MKKGQCDIIVISITESDNYHDDDDDDYLAGRPRGKRFRKKPVSKSNTLSQEDLEYLRRNTRGDELWAMLVIILGNVNLRNAIFFPSHELLLLLKVQ